MAESYSVKAILSAQDSGFSAAMKSASSAAGNLKSTLTSGLGFGILMGAGQQAFSAISSGIAGMTGELSSSSAAWKTFASNMVMTGKTQGEIKSIKQELRSFAEQTIYSSSDMASTFAQLEAVGTKNTTQLVKGFGGLAAAAENPKQAMKTLSTQATQMAAKPTVAWMDFKLMLEQTPAGISAVAKEMGMTTGELVKNVQNGSIATEDFFDAISKVGTNDAFTKLATEYKTVGQAMDGLQETMANKLQPAFDALSAIGIQSISRIVDKMGEINGDVVTGKIMSMVQTVTPYWQSFSGAVKDVASACGDAFGSIGNSLGEVLKKQSTIDTFKAAISGIAGVVEHVAGIIADNSDTIVAAIPYVAGLALAFKGFKILGPIITTIGSFGGLFKKGQPLGADSKPAGPILSLKEGLNSLQKCTGIALIVGALAGLALALKPLAELGVTAIPPLIAFGVVVGGLGIILANVGTKLQASVGGIIAFSASVSMMALAMYPIASTGKEGAIAMGAFGIVVAGLVVVFSVFGSALTAAIPGMLAFGATILLVGAGMALASVLINALTPFVKQLGDTVSQVSSSIASAVSWILSSFSGLVTAISGAVTQIVSVIGNTLVSAMQVAGDVISQVVASISDGFTKISDGVTSVVDSIGGAFSSVLESVASIIDSIGTASKNAGAGFKSVAEGIGIIADLSIIDIAKSLGAVAIGMGEISAQGSGLTTAANGVRDILSAVMLASGAVTVFNASLTLMGQISLVASQSIGAVKASLVGFVLPQIDIAPMLAAFSAIAIGARSMSQQMASAGAQAGENLTRGLSSGYSRATATTNSTLVSITSSIRTLPSTLIATGTQAGHGFTQGFTAGIRPAVTVAKNTGTAIVSSLRSASSGAYSCGYYIGQGLANGMSATLGMVRSVATQLAAAAEAAVVAKAKIGSPSRVFHQLGEFVGEGFSNGIDNMQGSVRDSAENLVAIPSLGTIPSPELTFNRFASGADGSLSEEYTYHNGATYTIIVPVDLEGREIAKVIAPYTQEELEKLASRNSRKRGNR